ncbi:MAG: hypothetical protein R3B72_32885 [Polyangiaceae bacterium]
MDSIHWTRRPSREVRCQAFASASHRSSSARRRWDTNFIEVSRFQVQRYNMLANCAEFVRGEVGAACHEKLVEVMAELEQDNLASGSICEPDIPSSTTCDTPQQFMLNGLMYPAFMALPKLRRRHDGPYAHPGSAEPAHLRHGPKWRRHRRGGLLGRRTESCMSSDGGDVTGCVNAPDSDGQTCMYPTTSRRPYRCS